MQQDSNILAEPPPAALHPATALTRYKLELLMPSSRDLALIGVFYPALAGLGWATGVYVVGSFAAIAGLVSGGSAALFMLRVAHLDVPVVGVAVAAYLLGALVAVGSRILLSRIEA